MHLTIAHNRDINTGSRKNGKTKAICLIDKIAIIINKENQL